MNWQRKKGSRAYAGGYVRTKRTNLVTNFPPLLKWEMTTTLMTRELAKVS